MYKKNKQMLCTCGVEIIMYKSLYMILPMNYNVMMKKTLKELNENFGNFFKNLLIETLKLEIHF